MGRVIPFPGSNNNQPIAEIFPISNIRKISMFDDSFDDEGDFSEDELRELMGAECVLQPGSIRSHRGFSRQELPLD